jgi:DNA mismatch repair protein MutS
MEFFSFAGTVRGDFEMKSHASLKQIGDLERLISKVSVGRINPREMNQLKKGIKNTHFPIKAILKEFQKRFS